MPAHCAEAGGVESILQMAFSVKLTSINSAPEESVSHNPAARKRVWFRQGELPPFTQIARVVVPPGEVLAAHAHPDMHELFIILEGAMRMVVDGLPHELGPDDALAVAPGESHELRNTGDKPAIFLVAGWTDETAAHP